jgi:ankyrin repeat protein
MTDDFDPLTRAVLGQDIAEIRRLVAAGADLNAWNEFGEPFLFDALFNTSHYDEATEADRTRYEIIALLLASGANPHELDSEGGNILIGPIFSRDAEMVELLLRSGVDPNRGCGEQGNTVYDLADFDYWVEVWCEMPNAPLQKPSANDLASEDAYVDFLDRAAQGLGGERPTILRLLRKYRALTRKEMARKLGGDGSERIKWRDGEWHLNQELEQGA